LLTLKQIDRYARGNDFGGIQFLQQKET
jgi:hypothetical protein